MTDEPRFERFPADHLPGSSWRTLAWEGPAPNGDMDPPIADSSDDHPPTVFDELVVDGWLHVEQMDTNHWWIGLNKTDGTHTAINIEIGEHGRAKSITIEEDI